MSKVDDSSPSSPASDDSMATTHGAEAMRAALDELERMRQLLHDIRNPVGSVSMAIEMLSGPLAASIEQLQGAEARRVNVTLDALRTSATQLRELVAYEGIDAVDYRHLRSRMEQGSPDLRTPPAANLPHVSTESAAQTVPATPPTPAPAPARAKKTRRKPSKPVSIDDIFRRLEILTVTRSALPALLAVDAEPELRLTINGSELLRCLSNLVENAIEASAAAAPGPGPWTVELGAHRYGEMLRIEIRNQGPALPPALIAWLDDATGQVAAPASTKSEGALHGVGLGAARSVAESFGGRLMAASDAGVTTFIVELPALPPAPIEESI